MVQYCYISDGTWLTGYSSALPLPSAGVTACCLHSLHIACAEFETKLQTDNASKTQRHFGVEAFTKTIVWPDFFAPNTEGTAGTESLAEHKTLKEMTNTGLSDGALVTPPPACKNSPQGPTTRSKSARKVGNYLPVQSQKHITVRSLQQIGVQVHLQCI